MQETSCKSIKKTLKFEKSGETLSIEISLENVSPLRQTEIIDSFLDVIYERAKKELRF